MYNNPFYIPSYYQSMTMPSMMRTANTLGRTMNGINTARNIGTATKGAGLFTRLGSSLTGLKSINWGGLINGTSKTLGVINQTIPLVKQVGPVFNNMKSMLKVASIFKDETDIPQRRNNQRNNYQPNNRNYSKKPNYQNQTYQQTNINTNQKNNLKEEYLTNQESNNSSPTFFIETT